MLLHRTSTWSRTLATLAFLASVAAGFELEVTPTGAEFVLPVGEAIVLTCSATGLPTERLSLVWKDPSGKAVGENPGARIYIEKESATSSQLYVTNSNIRDAGRYTCELLVGNVKQRDHNVNLIVFKGITFDDHPSPQNPELHTDALIRCRVSAEPKPEVSWRFMGRNLEPNERYSMDVNGLRIKNITRRDDGVYTCRAEVKSKGSYDERKINVVVHIRPSITRRLENVITKQGANLTINCRAEGLPPPKYEFMKGKTKLIPADHGRIFVDTDSGRIHFKPVQKEDEGDYTCVAINDVGEVKSSANIRVLEPPEIHELRNVTVTEHETASLVCKSRGDPAPAMQFRKVGSRTAYNESVSEGGRVHVRASTGRLQLEIKKATPTDAGNYTCFSHNEAGNASMTGSITVNFKPRFQQDQQERVAHIWAGKTHNITCNVQAEPPPDIDWLRYGQVVQNNETYHVFTTKTQSSLQVRVKEADQTWIYGIYACRAKNRLGEKQLEINMTRAIVPGLPTVRVKERSPNMIILEVEPPTQTGGKDVVGYRVEYGRKMMDFAIGFPGSRAESVPSNAIPPLGYTNRTTELVIENLKPATAYTFHIRAKNEVGVGHSTPETVITESYKAPYPIHIASHKQGKDPFEYRLVWHSPKTGGKPIQKYVIRYRQIETKNKVAKVEDWQDASFLDDQNSPSVEYRFQGLTPQSNYEVEISAKNEIGQSPKTTFRFFTNVLPSKVSSGVARCQMSLANLILTVPYTLIFGYLAAAAVWTTVSLNG